jgi:hypothetical protein
MWVRTTNCFLLGDIRRSSPDTSIFINTCHTTSDEFNEHVQDAEEKLEKYTSLWLRNLKARDHLGYIGPDGRMILVHIVEENIVKVWTERNWLRTEHRGFCFTK